MDKKNFKTELFLTKYFWMYLQPLVVVFVVASVTVGVILYFFFYKNSVENNNNQDAPVQESLEDLVEVYASEGAPVVQGEGDLENFGTKNVENDIPDSLGIFVFTGRNTNILPQMTMYFLDLDTKEIYVPSFLPKDGSFLFPEFINPLQPTDFFLQTVTTFSSESSNSQPKLHYYDTSTDQITYYDGVDDLTWARDFEWLNSDNPKLAFVRMKTSPSNRFDLLELESWEVVIFDPLENKIVTVLDEAIYPEWHPDGSKLIFLKSDGLYVYDVANDTQGLVWGVPEGSEIISTSMIDISPDGRHLIWTSPKSGVISIFELISDDSLELFEVQLIGRITNSNTEYYWPQFSPSNDYYAVQAIDKQKEGEVTRKNARLEIRQILSSNAITSYSLEGFNFNELFTDDWIIQ